MLCVFPWSQIHDFVDGGWPEPLEEDINKEMERIKTFSG